MIRDTDIPSMVVGGGARDPNPAAVRIAAVSDEPATGVTAHNRLHHELAGLLVHGSVDRIGRRPRRHRVKRMIVVKPEIASRIVLTRAVDHQAGPAASAAAAPQERISAGMVHLTEAGRSRGEWGGLPPTTMCVTVNCRALHGPHRTCHPTVTTYVSRLSIEARYRPVPARNVGASA